MKTIDVAIVEDLEEIREALRVLINGSQGFSCTHVYADAEQALVHLPDLEPDVALIDIHLPGKSGIECVQELKEQMTGTQFMMCTVYDDDDHIFDALKAGATGYILKRTSPAQILEAIRELHSGGSPMSSEVARRVINSIQKKNAPSEATEILTQREKEILDFLALGFLYKEIADKLSISRETVKKHIHNIYEKLHVQTRTEALNKAFQR
jgi:DNA-binding NarL/FixJ family response regulator